MRTQRLFVLSLSALALSALTSTEARAERGRNPLAGQPAIRHRVEMRKLRFEITPEFLVSINQPLLIGLGGGANLQFHINDWLGIAVSAHYTGNVGSPLQGNVEAALPRTYPTDPADPAAGLKQPTRQQFRDHIIGPSLLAAVYATLTPIGGKFSLFNSATAFYDFYGMAGIGLAILGTPLACSGSASDCGVKSDASRGVGPVLANGNDPNIQAPDAFTGPQFAGLLGIGAHFYFNQWLGLQFEVRDYLYKSNHGGLDVVTTDSDPKQKDKSPVLTSSDLYVTSNLYFGVGLTFLVPGAKISR